MSGALSFTYASLGFRSRFAFRCHHPPSRRTCCQTHPSGPDFIASVIAFTNSTRVFVALQPVDLRRSFSGLHGIILDVLHQDPTSGHLFLFTNKSRKRLKCFCWDGSGTWVATKRLESGKFPWPTGADLQRGLNAEEFYALVNGLKVERLTNWYRK